MTVLIEIDELVLSGILANARYAIADAVETSLAALIADQGLPACQSDVELETLPGLQLDIRLTDRPQAIGAALAEGLYRTLRSVLENRE